MKTCVVIPAYNEEKTISGITARVRNQGLEAVVINDGSSDQTARLAKEQGAIVISSLKNKGKGASLSLGFDYAMNNGYDPVVTMDADGQHLPEEIPLLLDLAQGKSNAFIIGNRMRDTRNMPWERVMTNSVMSAFISFLAHQHIPDTQCGFRLISTPLLKKLYLKTSGYETESEIIIKASRLGVKIQSVPIQTIYSREKSKINPFVDTIKFVAMIFKELAPHKRK
ncbi:MAG: glycosyltransferase family 2 protein [Candidatus Omnitrophica bacterium]|jgi:glycosyltransferase involved in cell wall biosynthesis|nr:glycosyltransferase family 2 protein [Candidatus Omnitrophota bacterium]